MRCYYQDKLEDFLEEKLSKEEMDFIQKHIENCQHCQNELEMLLDNPLNIPNKIIEVDDEILVSKIKARRKGRKRLVYYGILGLLLGLFSRFYVYDKFIVTKAIMAIPYKISEFVLGIFFSHNRLNPWQQMDNMYYFKGIGYFPFNPFLDVLAQYITPVIVGVFIALVIGYFTSDRRIFTRKKIIRFCIVGLAVFMLWVGTAFAVYSISLKSFEDLDNVRNTIVYSIDDEGTSLLAQVRPHNVKGSKNEELYNGLKKGKKINKQVLKKESEILLVMDFKLGGRILGYVDFDTNIMTTQKNTSFKLSDDVINILKGLRGGI